MVCNDVQVEPVLQEITGEVLTPIANRTVDVRLDIHTCGFWERYKSIASTRMRRTGFTPAGCERSNKARFLHH